MKNQIVIFIFILSISVAKAQQSDQRIIDSLRHEITIAKEDSNRIHLLLLLGNLYSQYAADSGAAYEQKALSLAEKINFQKGIYQSEFYLSGSLLIAGNYPLALDHSFNFLSLAEKAHDSVFTSIAYALIGECYNDLGQYETSLKYYLQNLRLAEALHINQIYFAWANMAHVYQSLHQPDSAILYARKACKGVSDWNDTLFVFNVAGDAYAGKANYDSALFYYRTSISVSIKNHTQIEQVDGYNGIARVYKIKTNYDSAAGYAKKALEERTEKSYPLGFLKAANMLADIYELQNRPDSTLKYLRIALNIKDSLFSREKTMAVQNIAFKEQEKQKEIEASKLKYQNRLRTYTLLGGLITLLLVAGILLRNNRNKQKAYTLLQNQKHETDTQKTKVEKTLEELKSTQNQLIQSEKMASLGELTAGIAHEIQNPLNFVNNFSEVNAELIEELKGERLKATGERNDQLENDLINDIAGNEEKINHHGKRADAIVKGMLQHSRSASSQQEPIDINALADEYLRLSYHGLRAKDKTFNATLLTSFDKSIEKINIIPQDIGRVLLNLYNNAFYACNELSKNARTESSVMPAGLHKELYEPTVSVSTKKENDKLIIKVKDNGAGIPQKLLEKIYQPFFTTKPAGQGTGLGLSLSYDIIKAHGGEITVKTKENEGAEFIIQLPASKI